MKECFKKFAHRLFAVDYRALAIARITFGIILFIDLIVRISDLAHLYVDTGIFTRLDVLAQWSTPIYTSAYIMSGSIYIQGALMVIQILCALALIVGYRTKLATILSWFLLISLHYRVPLVLNGGDLLLRVALFWAMFIPWGKYISLDVILNRVKEPKEKTIISAGTIGFMLQGAVMYFFTGILKHGYEWQVEHSAVYLTLSHDQFVTGIGEWLLTAPPVVLEWITNFVVHLEIVGPLLLFIPIFTVPMRVAVLFLFFIMQLGFNLTMHNIGLFGVISLAVLIPYLPSEFLDWKSACIRMRAKKGLTIFYDGNCTFCKKVTDILYTVLFLHKNTKLQPASVDEKVMKRVTKLNSWIVKDVNNKTYTHFDGIIAVCKHSPLLFWITPLLKIPGIYHIGQWAYRYIAKNRLTVCLPDKKVRTNLFKKICIILLNIFLIGMIVYMVVVNIRNYDTKYENIIPDEMYTFARGLHFNQRFNMFAPYPTRSDGWYLVIGGFTDGTQKDFFTGSGRVEPKTISYEKPENVSMEFKNNRWWRFFSNLHKSHYKRFKTRYLQYICKEWNANEDNKQLDSVQLYYINERTKLNFETGPNNRQLMHTINCYEG